MTVYDDTCLADAFYHLCMARHTLAGRDAQVEENMLSCAALALNGVTDPGAAMSAALTARDADLIRMVVAHFPDVSNWTRHAFLRDGLRPGTLAHEMRLDCLAALLEAGVALGSVLDGLALEALSQDRGDALDWLDTVAKWTKTPWPRKHLRNRLLACGPGCAAHLRRHLDSQILQDGNNAPRHSLRHHILPGGPHGATLKELAALLSSRHDITGLFVRDIDQFHPYLRELIEATASAHGQLRLRAMEPDPVELLGRHEHARFFGLDGQRFQVDFPAAT